ncbi:prefoldin subunit 2-like [Ciona intestinalis]
MSDKKLTKEEVVEGFNKLRQEQRTLATRIAQMESDKGEHGLVIDALEQVNGDRKCYRLVHGVLVERTVEEVLPALSQNKEQISSYVEMLTKQLVDKGKALNAYRVKHNVSVRGESGDGEKPKSEENSNSKSASGVLVSN